MRYSTVSCVVPAAATAAADIHNSLNQNCNRIDKNNGVKTVLFVRQEPKSSGQIPGDDYHVSCTRADGARASYVCKAVVDAATKSFHKIYELKRLLPVFIRKRGGMILKLLSRVTKVSPTTVLQSDSVICNSNHISTNKKQK
jgi:hypothetical protein